MGVSGDDTDISIHTEWLKFGWIMAILYTLFTLFIIFLLQIDLYLALYITVFGSIIGGIIITIYSLNFA
jgi:hypothetical protein